MALTTTVKLQTRLGSAADSYTAGQLSAAVAAACAQIEHYCARVFDAATYAEWADGPKGQVLSLPQYPILQLYAAYTAEDVLDIGYSGSSTRAVVAVTDSGDLSLLVGDDPDHADSVSLTLSEYTDLAALAVAVNALSGWSATVQAECRPVHLRPRIYGDALDTLVTLTGPGEVIAATLVDADAGLVKGSWPSNPMILYRAGYATIPADLEDIATRLAADLLSIVTHDGSLKSERIGDYSYELSEGAANGLITRYTPELAAWRRPYA